ncbi:MAG: urease accessory protein UreD [Hoeflea sp.]|uniref:urease accessory protein UreD n=1 Tax=Hoeflea sp. TaxID=1940281 RepID=UPI0032EE21CF
MTSVFPVPTAARDAPDPGASMQRARGAGRLSVKSEGTHSRIDRLYQDGCARIRLPRVQPGAPLEAVMINTAGGLTGGDRMDWQFEAGAGARMSLTTQACEKTYKAQGDDPARVSVRLMLAEGSSMAWLPQETILFDRALLQRTIDVEMPQTARLLLVEPLLFGRLAMNESVIRGAFRDRWRIRVEGRLLHAEDTSFGPDVHAQLQRGAIADGGLALATVLMIAPEAEGLVEAVRGIICPAGGASFVSSRCGKTGKLLARIVAADSYELRKRLASLIRLLNAGGGVPKVWTT